MKKSHISLKLLALLLAVTFSITACDGSPGVFSGRIRPCRRGNEHIC